MTHKTILLGALCALSMAAQAQTNGVRVLEYNPAPGQFINNLPDINASMTAEQRLQACQQQLDDHLPVCLGTLGGYITVGFDTPIQNTKGSDLRILGNAYYAAADPAYGAATIGGSIEPGIVYAGVGDTPETAAWYELAGSEYYTTQTHGVTITYQKPTEEQGEHKQPYSIFDNYIHFRAEWTDNNGNPCDTTGWMMKNVYHQQSYWPTWEQGNTLTFKASRLPNNAINYGGTGAEDSQPQNWISYRYAADAYGYADATPNTELTYNTFDLDWAVDKQGNPVKLTHANFIRIQTATLQMCGWIGEQSTEVTAIENLHLQPGYDNNPIIITLRQRPTAISGITSQQHIHATARYTIDGQRISHPQSGINIVRYSDGSTRKEVVK